MLKFEGVAQFTNNVKWLRVNSNIDGTTANAMWPTAADEEFAPNDKVTVLILKTADIPEALAELTSAA